MSFKILSTARRYLLSCVYNLQCLIIVKNFPYFNLVQIYCLQSEATKLKK